MDSFEKSATLPLLHSAGLGKISRQLARTAAHYDRTGAFPHENIEILREAGIVGLPASRLLANAQLSLPEAQEIIAAVARGEPSTALVLIMTWLFVLQASENSRWTPELRKILLHDIALNGSLANALRVEPDLGTPVRGGLPKTTARRVPGGFCVSGHKLYSTGIPALKWLAVWGRTDDEEPLVGNFLVPAEAPGLRIVETWDQLGLRASGSHDVILEDVFIPEQHALDIRPLRDWGTARLPALNAWMSVLLSTLYDSVARNARDWLVQFALERSPANLGAPLATLPRFQEALGQIEALLHINKALIDRGKHSDIEAFSTQDGNFLKHIVTRNAIEVTQKALALTGNPGLSRANPLERHYRDALCGRVHSPQDDTILMSAGQAAFAAGPSLSQGD